MDSGLSRSRWQESARAAHNHLHLVNEKALEAFERTKGNAPLWQIEDPSGLGIDEMMMHIESGIEHNVSLFDDQLSEKPLLYKQIQRVVDSRARDHDRPARLLSQLGENLIRRRVVLGDKYILPDSEALGRRLDPRRDQPLGERSLRDRRVQHRFRLYLKLEPVYSI